MANDFFQDIVPPKKEEESPYSNEIEHKTESVSIPINKSQTPLSVQGIRTINTNRTKPGTIRSTMDFSSGRPILPPKPQRGNPQKPLLWIVIGLIIVAFIGLFFFFTSKHTLVMITVQQQQIVFGPTTQFTALPYSATSTDDTVLTYTTKTLDYDDSDIVAASGGVAVAGKASGLISVVNNGFAKPIRLVKGTRFETSSGLIFKTPADILIPAKVKTTPGMVNVTVVADQSGSTYNIAASSSKLRLPGLKSNAAMYNGIYATVISNITGGSGEGESATDPNQRQATIAMIRSRMGSQIHTMIQNYTGTTTAAFPGLAQTVYTEEQVPEGTSSVRIKEHAHVVVPVFSAPLLLKSITKNLSIDTIHQSYILNPADGYDAQLLLGVITDFRLQPITFVISGSATLIAQVNPGTLKAALVGKNQSTFQSIIATFPGIIASQAHIEPFWAQSFPTDPNLISIIINDTKDKTQ